MRMPKQRACASSLGSSACRCALPRDVIQECAHADPPMVRALAAAERQSLRKPSANECGLLDELAFDQLPRRVVVKSCNTVKSRCLVRLQSIGNTAPTAPTNLRKITASFVSIALARRVASRELPRLRRSWDALLGCCCDADYRRE